jgi:hypothetical protein
VAHGQRLATNIVAGEARQRRRTLGQSLNLLLRRRDDGGALVCFVSDLLRRDRTAAQGNGGSGGDEAKVRGFLHERVPFQRLQVCETWSTRTTLSYAQAWSG